MPNNQIYPSSAYPSNGDIKTTPGSPQTTVVGIQTVPFSATPPLTGQVPIFDGTKWVPSSTTLSDNDSISVNGITVSDDYQIAVNGADASINQVNSVIPPDAFPVYVNGSPAN